MMLVSPIAPFVWVILGGFGGASLVFLACCGWWMAHAEVGVDPFADLPAFDDDEAQRLLETGA